MTIFTRRGDNGDTSLPDGTRVSKASVRVEAYGAVDEANAVVGLARAAVSDPAMAAMLRFAQHRLMSCAALLATPAQAVETRIPAVRAADVTALETAIVGFEQRTSKLTHFVIEGGSDAACRLHVARAVVRRTERRVVALHAELPVDANVLAFLNRLSDALFAAARVANALDGVPEEPWDPAAADPEA